MGSAVGAAGCSALGYAGFNLGSSGLGATAGCSAGLTVGGAGCIGVGAALRGCGTTFELLALAAVSTGGGGIDKGFFGTACV